MGCTMQNKKGAFILAGRKNQIQVLSPHDSQLSYTVRAFKTEENIRQEAHSSSA